MLARARRVDFCCERLRLIPVVRRDAASTGAARTSSIGSMSATGFLLGVVAVDLRVRRLSSTTATVAGGSAATFIVCRESAKDATTPRRNSAVAGTSDQTSACSRSERRPRGPTIAGVAAAATSAVSGIGVAVARRQPAGRREICTMLPHFGHDCTWPRNRSSRTLSRAWQVSQRRKNGSTRMTSQVGGLNLLRARSIIPCPPYSARPPPSRV